MHEDIEFLENILLNDKKNIKDNYFDHIYPFTNENISAYYKNIDFENKKVLTVVGSGDHILNAFLDGAKSVDAFDINPLAKHYTELKIAAIKTFDLKDYILFFYPSKTYQYMNINKIFSLCDSLKVEEVVFWSYCYVILNSLNNLFNYDIPKLKDVIKANEYLHNETNYYKLRKILKEKEPKFYDLNIFDLDENNKKYDIILLSNIVAYLDLFYKDDYTYLKKLRDVLNNIKNEDSVVLLSYLYGGLINRKDALGIYNPYRTEKYFPSTEYEYIKVNKTNKIKELMYGKDKIIISKTKREKY